MKKDINGELLSLSEAVNKHHRLIHMVCLKYTGRAKRLGLDYDDLFSIGAVGLIKAFRRFDPETYPVRFATYAIPLIQGEIQREMRDVNIGPKYPREYKELAYKVLQSEVLQNGINDITPELIAKELGIDEQKALDTWEYIFRSVPDSMQKNVMGTEDKGNEVTLQDMCGSEADYTEILVEDFINSLTEKEQIVVRGLMSCRTQGEIGKEIGVSQVQVSRILLGIRSKYLMSEHDPRKQKQMKQEFLEMGGGLARAKQLLAETDLPVVKIAQITGANCGSLYVYSGKIREGKQTISTRVKRKTAI